MKSQLFLFASIVLGKLTGERRMVQAFLVGTTRTAPPTLSPLTARETTRRCGLSVLQVSHTRNDIDTAKKQKLPRLGPENKEEPSSSLSLELIGLGAILTALTTLILVNQFVGPWPEEVFLAMPPPAWLLLHYLGGVLFAGGIVVTTALEWLVVETTAAGVKDDQNDSNSMAPVLDFLFERVPVMDAALVVPGLGLALVSGIAVATQYYDGLATSPPHIVWAFRVLVAFAIWWAVTDVATQGPAAQAVQEWKESRREGGDDPLPPILYRRRLSNIGSCLFVVALYAIMALKPGTYY